MQAHGFHQHLIAVSGAIESTSARAVVGRGFGCQQFFAGHLALCVLLAHFGFSGVIDAGAHWPSWHKHAWQMTKLQGAD